MAKKKKNVKPTKAKTELGKKLCAVRKQMGTDQKKEWYEWFKTEKADLSEATFEDITRGEYISKDNIKLAMKGLTKGRQILEGLAAEIEQVVKAE